MHRTGARDDGVADQRVLRERSGRQRSQILEAFAGIRRVRNAVETVWNSKRVGRVGAKKCSGILIADHTAVAAPGARRGVLRVAFALRIEHWIRYGDSAAGETCAAGPRRFAR